MENKEISVTINKTVNTGNYNSFKASGTYTGTVKKNENLDEAYKHAWDIVEEQVNNAISREIGDE